MRRLLAAAAVALVASGCSTPFTPDRLAPDFAETFAGLYEAQQRTLGRRDFDRAVMQPQADCRRNGPAPDGPGEDWLCRVHYLDGVQPGTQQFEVQVKPDGCWKGEGPPAFQPAQLTDPFTGKRSANPLAEFDGCLDTSWR